MKNVPVFDLLDDEVIVSIFLMLFETGFRFDGINFVWSCKRIRKVFTRNVYGVGTGVGHLDYVNYLDSHMTRVIDLTDLKSKIKSRSFTKQRTLELQSCEFVRTFLMSDDELALHCSNYCCSESRNRVNSNQNVKYSLEPAIQNARYVSSSKNGEIVHYCYHTQKSLPNEFPPRRSYISKVAVDAASVENALQLDCTDIVSTFRFNSIDASPDGRFCMIRIGEYVESQVFVWDTETNTTFRITLVIPLTHGVVVIEEASPARAWWASKEDGKYHLLVAWQGDIFFHEGDAIANTTGFAIVCHSHGPNEKFESQSILLDFQFAQTFNAHFSEWTAAIYIRYIDGKFAFLMYDFHPDNASLEVYSISASTTPNPVFGEANHELFTSPISTCVSSDRSRIAILAEGCTNCLSAPPPNGTDENGAVISKSLILILFTKAPGQKIYYRQCGGRDEVYLSKHATQPSALCWQIDFSPCGSFISVVYTLNQLSIIGDQNYPSVYFVKMGASGLVPSRAVTNSKTRQLSWRNYSSILAMIKYGAVTFNYRN